MSRNLKITRYRTLRECLAAFGLRPDDKGWWKWMDASGKKHRMSYSRSIEKIKEKGYWGFIDNKRTIHVWARTRTPMADVVGLLAHEIGHAQKPYHRTLLEEEKASKYELVAKSAYLAARDLMK